MLYPYLTGSCVIQMCFFVILDSLFGRCFFYNSVHVIPDVPPLYSGTRTDRKWSLSRLLVGFLKLFLLKASE